MDFFSIISEILKAWWWLIPVPFVIGFFKSPRFKGWFGEYLVRRAAWFCLFPETYHSFHNVTLRTPNGGTTQIDHIFVSCYGIFVVETKNMKGCISGGKHESPWTQQFPKQSFKFQNPLHQNFKHVKALEAVLVKALGAVFPAEAIHSVVVFAGDNTFKSAMPANVTRVKGYITYIKSFDKKVLTKEQVREVVKQIACRRLGPLAKQIASM